MPRSVVTGRTIYEDPRITLSSSAIVVRGYWLPFGWPRTIRIADIERVEVETRSPEAPARWPRWGKGAGSTWFALDASRPRREVAVAIVHGTKRACVVTPANPERFCALLGGLGVPGASPPHPEAPAN